MRKGDPQEAVVQHSAHHLLCQAPSGDARLTGVHSQMPMPATR